MLSITGNAATSLGLRALNRIMSGARKISPADVNPREYVKRGGAVSALDDFYAALPNNMRYTQEPNKVSSCSRMVSLCKLFSFYI